MSVGALLSADSRQAVKDQLQEVSDEHVIDVYNYATRMGAISATSLELAALRLGIAVPEVSAAIARLVELRLLRAEGEFGDRLLPMDPQLAASLLTSPIERAISEQRELVDRLRQRIDTIARPRGVGAHAGSAVDSFEGESEIAAMLELAAHACCDEMIILRPAHDDQTLERLLDTCFYVLDRGVNVRLLSPHRSRASFGSRAKAKRMIERGAVIRTVSHVPQASVVFDRSLALMFSRPEDGCLPAARRVRDDNIVWFLIDMFDQMWDGAAPFAWEDPGYADDVTDDLQRAIARLMAQGLTDEVVARRLGMSIRTCRRHIAALLRNLDSVSRFQAGVQAARRLTTEDALGA